MAIKPKKVVLFIVEGFLEVLTFEAILTQIMNKNRVKFDIIYGDITSCNNIDANNIISELNLSIVNYMNNENTFNEKDIEEIIHIIDTDGAFIPPTAVVEQRDINSIIYTESRIIVKKSKFQKNMMARKKRIVSKLNTINSINIRGLELNYHVYYLSRNLEHALWNESDILEDKKKVN